MANPPPKPLPELEIERLRWENAELQATIQRLEKRLQQLVESQRSLAKAHEQLEETHRRLMREREAAQSPRVEILQKLKEEPGKGGR